MFCTETKGEMRSTVIWISVLPFSLSERNCLGKRARLRGQKTFATPTCHNQHSFFHLPNLRYDVARALMTLERSVPDDRMI